MTTKLQNNKNGNRLWRLNRKVWDFITGYKIFSGLVAIAMLFTTLKILLDTEKYHEMLYQYEGYINGLFEAFVIITVVTFYEIFELTKKNQKMVEQLDLKNENMIKASHENIADEIRNVFVKAGRQVEQIFPDRKSSIGCINEAFDSIYTQDSNDPHIRFLGVTGRSFLKSGSDDPKRDDSIEVGVLFKAFTNFIHNKDKHKRKATILLLNPFSMPMCQRILVEENKKIDPPNDKITDDEQKLHQIAQSKKDRFFEFLDHVLKRDMNIIQEKYPLPNKQTTRPWDNLRGSLVGLVLDILYNYDDLRDEFLKTQLIKDATGSLEILKYFKNIHRKHIEIKYFSFAPQAAVFQFPGFLTYEQYHLGTLDDDKGICIGGKVPVIQVQERASTFDRLSAHLDHIEEYSDELDDVWRIHQAIKNVVPSN